MESTIERLHYKLEYADRDIGKLAPHSQRRKLTTRYLIDKRRERGSSRRNRKSLISRSLLATHADKQDLLKEDELPLRQISLEEIEPKLRDETVSSYRQCVCSELIGRNEKNEIN